MKKMRLFLAAVIAMSTVALYSCGGGANTTNADSLKKDSVKVETTAPVTTTDASTGANTATTTTPQQ